LPLLSELFALFAGAEPAGLFEAQLNALLRRHLGSPQAALAFLLPFGTAPTSKSCKDLVLLGWSIAYR